MLKGATSQCVEDIHHQTLREEIMQKGIPFAQIRDYVASRVNPVISALESELKRVRREDRKEWIQSAISRQKRNAESAINFFVGA